MTITLSVSLLTLSAVGCCIPCVLLIACHLWWYTYACDHKTCGRKQEIPACSNLYTVEFLLWREGGGMMWWYMPFALEASKAFLKPIKPFFPAGFPLLHQWVVPGENQAAARWKTRDRHWLSSWWNWLEVSVLLYAKKSSFEDMLVFGPREGLSVSYPVVYSIDCHTVILCMSCGHTGYHAIYMYRMYELIYLYTACKYICTFVYTSSVCLYAQKCVYVGAYPPPLTRAYDVLHRYTVTYPDTFQFF